MARQNPERLACISLLVCDEVYRDELSKKLIVVGIFNQINARAVPCKHSRLNVLFSLTNAKGEYDLTLYLEHEKSGNRVVEVRGPLTINDPLTVSDINLEMRDIQFGDVGKYWVTLEADNEILAQRPFWVAKLEEKPQ